MHLYADILRLGSAATDAGALDWLRALVVSHGVLLLSHGVHQTVQHLGGALHLPHWLVK